MLPSLFRPAAPHDPVFRCGSAETFSGRPFNATWQPEGLSDAFLSARLKVAARLMGIDTQQATHIYLRAVSTNHRHPIS